jgi:acetoin:2,6-dichlorophenolindophenol oxidoreductase subunit alpha
VASRLIGRARRGEGPSFVLCNTYRYRGHHVGDINREYYRAKQEEQRWSSERDPINLLRDWMLQQKLADSAQLERIQTEVKAEMNAAVEFAIAAPYPEVQEAQEDVYA